MDSKPEKKSQRSSHEQVVQVTRYFTGKEAELNNMTIDELVAVVKEGVDGIGDINPAMVRTVAGSSGITVRRKSPVRRPTAVSARKRDLDVLRKSIFDIVYILKGVDGLDCIVLDDVKHRLLELENSE